MRFKAILILFPVLFLILSCQLFQQTSSPLSATNIPSNNQTTINSHSINSSTLTAQLLPSESAVLLTNTLNPLSPWSIKEIEKRNDNKELDGGSMTIDSLNQIHISYILGVDLIYMTGSGSDWRNEIVDQKICGSLVTSIVVDTSNRPHITYSKCDTGLKHAFFNGEKWTIEDVDTDPNSGGYPSIAINNDGAPSIVYCQYYHEKFYPFPSYCGFLKYAHYQNNKWIVEDIEETKKDSEDKLPNGKSNGNWSSISFDSSGSPHIIYEGGNGLVYITRTNNWEYYSFDGMYGHAPVIYIDGKDKPRIIFTLNQNSKDMISEGSLMFMQKNGNEWKTEVIDSLGKVCQYYGRAAYITRDNDNNPNISYYSYNGAVKYAYYNGSKWNIETIDENSIIHPQDSSCHEMSLEYVNTVIKIDSNNHPHILYEMQNRLRNYIYLNYAWRN